MSIYAKIGSVSSGTFVPRDLAWAFHFDLKKLAEQDTEDAERKKRTLDALEPIGALLKQEANETPEATAVFDTFHQETAPELFEAYCAPFTSFGSHPGDGADFGIWPDVESAQEQARYRDGVVSVPAGDEWPELEDDIDYVLEVNDHGNVSLYNAHTKQPLWDCV